MGKPSLAELISYLDSLDAPHILCGVDYRILAANTAYRQSFGADDVVGRTCYSVSHRYEVPCDRAGETCPLKQSLASGRRERVLHLHHTSHGEVYVNIELSPVRDVKGLVAYFIEKIEPMGAAIGRDDQFALIGRAPGFLRMLELVTRVAPSDTTVMLQGESGTGKELVARAIHDASGRAARPFVVVDCSGLTETLFESELFGHEKGAFTGAAARRIGLVESAVGGTLFLDELGDIPLGMQVKLLRLLETGTFRRVGATELLKADVRLISATHRNLRGMVADGHFRQDLYYRLNTFPINLPALRERQEDIPRLVSALLSRVSGGRNLRLSVAALDVLTHYDYPGNVRELRNVLERAALLCDGGEIHPEHLPAELQEAYSGMSVITPKVDAGGALRQRSTLAELQEATLRDRLAHHHGNRKSLAAELGISERTLYRRLRHIET